MKDRVIFITGASSGIGKVCAEYLSEKGYTVIGAARRFSDNLQKTGSFYTVRLDVTSDASVDSAVKAVIEKFGRIDVLINNAGYSISGPVDDTAVEEAKREFEVNFFGAFRVIKAILPHMRAQNSGLIINMSSLASIFTLPYQVFYSASKAALDVLTEGLLMELKSIGSNVEVVAIRPNDYRTEFTDHRQFIENFENSIYHEPAKKALKVAEEGERKGPHPIEIAKLVEKIINTKSPAIFYPTGSNASLLSFLKRIVPDRLRIKLLMKNFKIG